MCMCMQRYDQRFEKDGSCCIAILIAIVISYCIAIAILILILIIIIIIIIISNIQGTRQYLTNTIVIALPTQEDHVERALEQYGVNQI